MSSITIDELPTVQKIIKEANAKIKNITGVTVRLSINTFLTIIDEKKLMLQDLVCEAYNLSWKQIKSNTRQGFGIIDARHVYMYISHEYLNIPLSQIGKDCGMRTHSAVLSAVRKIRGYVETKDPITEIIEKIIGGMSI